MPHRAQIVPILLGVVVVAMASCSSSSKCGDDSECPGGEVCLKGGGVLFAGGRCVPRSLLQPDAVGRRVDTGSPTGRRDATSPPTDTPTVDTSSRVDTGRRQDSMLPDVPGACCGLMGCTRVDSKSECGGLYFRGKQCSAVVCGNPDGS